MESCSIGSCKCTLNFARVGCGLGTTTTLGSRALWSSSLGIMNQASYWEEPQLRYRQPEFATVGGSSSVLESLVPSSPVVQGVK